MAFYNWFLPNKDTHQKAHLISWNGILIYILIFILLQVSFSIISYTKPGVLGISANISQQRLIELTNQERAKQGLPPVTENAALDQAAAAKAQNMIAENYWAHFAPSGKSPWDFILGSGYKFSFAGENLAKNFYSSDEVVAAWMNSPTHRDNLLNSKYKEIGMAVVEGNLNGQQTTLIVQMFGTSQQAPVPVAQVQPSQQSPPQQTEQVAAAQQPKVAVSGQEITVPKEDIEKPPVLIASTNLDTPITKPLIDPYITYKTIGFSVILIMMVLLGIDLIVLRRRGVLRIGSHHIAHMSILTITASSLLTAGPGAIL